jgi:ATP-dependent RNA helicase DDX1
MAGGFEALGLAPELIKAVYEDMGWFLPTDIQDEAIPLILGGGDVMAAAETGSGKTAAFALPMVQLVHETIRGVARQTEAIVPIEPMDVAMSSHDKDSLFQVTDGSVCENKAQRWLGGRATHGVHDGRYYYEATVDASLAGEGICR